MPWVGTTASIPDPPPWLGQILHLREGSVQGPGPLNCLRAQLEATTYPAEGLFQGNLPRPARAAALALGISDESVSGVRLTCDSGVFELHRADSQTLLLALETGYGRCRAPRVR